jgi:hypothetical protein
LVLTRKSQEAVVVGGADRFERLLKVTVLEIKGGKVRLGFEADIAPCLSLEQQYNQLSRSALAGWPPFLLDLSLVGGRHLTNLTIPDEALPVASGWSYAAQNSRIIGLALLER